jgi:transposase
MKFYNKQHKYYCGIDLHKKTMYICIQDRKGKILVHRNIRTESAYFLKVIRPYKKDLVVAVECMFSWYWLADLCAEQGITFVLGHALYMKAIHGGKAKNDRIDSLKICTLLRGGLIPKAYVYPSEMRSTRDLLRRRMYIVHMRSEFNVHVQNTNTQYNLPDIGKDISRKSNREGVAERFQDAGAQKSVEIDLTTMDYLDKTLQDLELFILRAARKHDAKTIHLLRTVTGIGKILSLVIFYEIQDINRFSRVQEFISYSRLVKCASESAGKKQGTSGAKIGNVHLKWAFSEAAVLFIRGEGPERQYYEKLVRKHGTGKALSILAAKLGRAVYFMLKRRKAFDIEKFLKA